uniref:C2H2-type domain-containing protein n=1 Tax=Xiphophorus maculatus TaxID=8083 RepID=A0A3B5R7E0_XIPMA
AAHLKRHQNIHSAEQSFLCPQCGNTFTQKETLKLHLERVHGRLQPYGCQDCGKRFSKRSNLKVHQLLHTPGQNLNTAPVQNLNSIRT